MKKVKYKRYHYHGKGIPRTYDYSVGIVLKENTIHWKIKDIETGIEIWRIKDNVETIHIT